MLSLQLHFNVLQCCLALSNCITITSLIKSKSVSTLLLLSYYTNNTASPKSDDTSYHRLSCVYSTSKACILLLSYITVAFRSVVINQRHHVSKPTKTCAKYYYNWHSQSDKIELEQAICTVHSKKSASIYLCTG